MNLHTGHVHYKVAAMWSSDIYNLRPLRYPANNDGKEMIASAVNSPNVYSQQKRGADALKADKCAIWFQCIGDVLLIAER